MNTKVILLALSVVTLGSCSTAYKMGQTPDDVYFSPGKEQNEYVAVENQEDRYLPQNNYNSYNNYDGYRNDRLLRMSVGNRMRLSAFDTYNWYDGYYNNWQYQSYGLGYNSPWNSYFYWNNYFNPYNRYNYYFPYNPYYGGGVVYGGKVPVTSPSPISRPRALDPAAYSNRGYNNNNLYLYKAPSASGRPSSSYSGNRYNNRNNSNSTLGNSLKKVFSPRSSDDSYYNSNNNSNNNSNSGRTYTPSRSNDAPVRTYTPPASSSNSSSSSSSSSGGGGISRPTRGN